jgi:ParB/RepB/Spo0J family partition protein
MAKNRAQVPLDPPAGSVAASVRVPLSSVVADDAWNPRSLSTIDEGSEDVGSESPAVKDLAESIASQGQLQPCVARRLPDGRWFLLAGFRRFRALRLIEAKEVWITPYEGDPSGVPGAENVRKNLEPHETAQYVSRLLHGAPKLGVRPLPPAEIARRMGLSRTVVDTYVGIVKNLDPRIMDQWMRTPGAFAVRDLAAIRDLPHDKQWSWYERRYRLGIVDKDPAPRGKVERRRGRGLTKRQQNIRDAMLSGAYDDRGAEWVRGALAVFDWIETGDPL